MNDNERLELSHLFVAAVQKKLGHPKDSVPLDARAFAEAVQEIGEGNRVATRFRVYRTISGPACPDFQQGMTLAQSAGLISRLNPSYERFVVDVSPRQRADLEKQGLFEDALVLADEYLKRAAGSAGASRDRLINAV